MDAAVVVPNNLDVSICVIQCWFLLYVLCMVFCVYIHFSLNDML